MKCGEFNISGHQAYPQALKRYPQLSPGSSGIVTFIILWSSIQSLAKNLNFGLWFQLPRVVCFFSNEDIKRSEDRLFNRGYAIFMENVAQMIKRLSTMREIWVRFLGWEDPLEKEMAIHSRTSAWKSPWTEEPGRLQSMRSQRVGHD